MMLLTIGILTRNQPAELQRAIESILPQMRDGVEIVVNDNSDNLETKQLIEKKYSTFPIRYFKNNLPTQMPSKWQFDKSVFLITKRAKGKYIWFFGDDKMEPGAIDYVLKIIKKYQDLSFMFMNFYISDQGKEFPILPLSSDKIFDDRNLVLEEVLNVLGFLSVIIIKRASVAGIKSEEIDKFMGSGFMNLYLAMNALAQPGRYYICAKPFVAAYPIPPGKPRPDSFYTFAVDFLEVANNFKSKFRKKSIKKMLAKNFGHIWRGVLVESVRGRDVPRRRLKTLFKYYWNFPEFWIALPFFLMPRFINVFLYKSYKKLTGGSGYLKQNLSKVPWF